jgi:hypothetical protein
MKTLKFYTFLVIMAMSAGSCHFYKFTGASIPANAKTVSVDYFKYSAQTINPTLNQDITEKLRDKLTGQTRLSLIDGKGDLQFKGEIVDYSISPVALSATESASQNKLTIKVKVEFINEIDETKNFSKTFTADADYDSQQILTDVEPRIVPGIVEKLVEDIFQEAVVNW